ncbi:MAG: CBS domain-containing protein, partial [Gemmatimonadaceae bacterium]
MSDHTPELLYLLHGDPSDLAEMLSTMRAADVADAINRLDPPAAAKVLAALPFDLAGQVLDQPELEDKAKIFGALVPAAAAPLIEAMSADERADLFRRLSEPERARFIKLLGAETKKELERLLDHAPDTAGGIMTTEFVSAPGSWTVDETLRYIGEVGGAKETVYMIYVLDREQRLAHVVSLRDLLLAERHAMLMDVGPQRKPLSVHVDCSRDEATRIISKYNLLALPVVDERDHVLGIVTVDDVIDAIVQERSEDVVRFGGMEAIDEPYSDLGFMQMIRKRAPWLCALFLSEMLTATAMQRFQG